MKLLKLFGFVVCLIDLNIKTFAQSDSLTNAVEIVQKNLVPPPSQQKDVMDFASKVFKKLKFNNHDDGAMEEGKKFMWFLPAIGYTLQTEIAFAVEANIVWRNKGAKVSSIISDPTYTQLKQIYMPIRTDIWTKNNRYNIIGDWRIAKYPQETYGLGSTSPITNNDLIDGEYLKIFQYVLKNMGNNFFVGAGVNFDYHWNTVEKGDGENVPSDYKSYSHGQRSTTSSGLALNILYNTRDNLVAPEKGEFFNLLLRTNYTWLGSDSNWQSLLMDLRKYINFPSGSSNILGLWMHNWLTLSGNPPYLDLPSTGYDSYGNTQRGYIQGRYRGKNMLYFETEYRFNLTHNHWLGGVVFGNVGSFSETLTTNRFEKFTPGYGAGFRFKLNKYSRLNMAIDYAFGVEGSRGLFVNVGEVF